VQHDSAGLPIFDVVPPDPPASGAYLLDGAGEARYRQIETTARLRLAEERELFFSYVYSRARGDLNDFGTYLGTFPGPVIRPNRFGNLPGSIPNRFLAWGLFKIWPSVRVAPVIEYRTGFPYIVTAVRRSAEPQPFPRILVRGCPRDAGLQGKREVHGAALAERLQPDEPLQPGSGPLEYRRSALRRVLRPPRAKIYRRFRRAVLIAASTPKASSARSTGTNR
jgi:hypothetical protein